MEDLSQATSDQTTETTTVIETTYDWTTTTTEHYQEILNRDVDRLLVVMTRIKEFLVSAQNNDTKREKRSKSTLSEEEKRMCSTLRWLPRKLGEIKDGGIYSLAKMKVASFLQAENIDLLEGMTAMTVKECLIDIFRGDEEMKTKFVTIYSEKMEEFSLFNEVKQYPDSLDGRRDDVCVVGDSGYQNSECLCECHKEEKLAVYDIFASLEMIENMDFERAGDLWSWYYNEFFERLPYESPSTPKVKREVSEEIRDFEKEILQNISNTNVQLGLSDFVSIMAQPVKVWRSQFDFPRLYSFNRKTQEEIFSLFNYNERLTIRNQQELTEPDFLNFSLPSHCRGGQASAETEYCKLTENLPDLKTTLTLMNLAQYPLEIQEQQLNSILG